MVRLGKFDKSVCLCMIVRNEADVIGRCLSSVHRLIDQWLIIDTGSTDGTQDVVQSYLSDIPGRLVERPWIDFSFNRTEALALARPLADYTLIIDADDVIEVPACAHLPALEADSYTIEIRDTSVSYHRTQLVRNALPWRYVGVLHEFITCDEASTTDRLPLRMLRNHDGARRRNPDTYSKDAAVLERAIEIEADPLLRSRYIFYLAQSYRDCGERAKAIVHYLTRAGLGYWDQEVFVSLYEAAKLMDSLGYPIDIVAETFESATKTCPSRIEAMYAQARIYRLSGEFIKGYAVAKMAQPKKAPQNGLFVEEWIYDYGLDDELSVLAYWAGHDRDCVEAAERALASPVLPPSERPRVEANRQFAMDRMVRSSMASNGWVPNRPQGGTEIMVEALRERLGSDLNAIDLCVNLYNPVLRGARPLVVWLHHDVDQAAVQWCQNPALIEQVSCFVFISHWQKDRYISNFNIPPERCTVIKYAIDTATEVRLWEPTSTYRCAYTSTPFRGLDILLDAWERIPEGSAELHVWSSMKLYNMDNGPYNHLIKRAQTMPSVVYHGLMPNTELRKALRTMHFLTYPNTFAETSCLSAIEALSAGCRVIAPSYGALPETTGGYARLYPWSPDKTTHANLFAKTLMQEIECPWGGYLDKALKQQAHCASVFAWDQHLDDWRRLISDLCAGSFSYKGHLVRND